MPKQLFGLLSRVPIPLSLKLKCKHNYSCTIAADIIDVVILLAMDTCACTYPETSWSYKIDRKLQLDTGTSIIQA